MLVIVCYNRITSVINLPTKFPRMMCIKEVALIVCVCVCLVTNLDITAQSGPVELISLSYAGFPLLLGIGEIFSL